MKSLYIKFIGLIILSITMIVFVNGVPVQQTESYVLRDSGNCSSGSVLSSGEILHHIYADRISYCSENRGQYATICGSGEVIDKTDVACP